MGFIDEDGDYSSLIHYPIWFMIVCLVVIIFSLVAYYYGSSIEKDKLREQVRQAEFQLQLYEDEEKYFSNYLQRCEEILKTLDKWEDKEVYVDILELYGEVVCCDFYTNESDEGSDYPLWEYKFIKRKKTSVSRLRSKYHEQSYNARKKVKENKEILKTIFEKTSYLS